MEAADVATPHKANASIDYIPQDLLDTLAQKNRLVKKRSQPGNPRLKHDQSQLLESLSISPSEETDATVRPAYRTLSKDAAQKPIEDAFPESAMLVPDRESVKDKEIAELKARVRQLEADKAALSGPAVDIEELQRQFKSQELLLSGYQKENERAVTELHALRTRERQIAAHLTRLYGDNWEDQVLQADFTKVVASPNVPSAPLATLKSPRAVLASDTTSAPQPDQDAQEQSRPLAAALPFDPSSLLAHIATVQLLIKNMEVRLNKSDSDLSVREKRAIEEARQARARA